MVLRLIVGGQDTVEEAPKTALWRGKVKHQLKTAEGASIVELFSLQALVPEKLMEQMPPTLFVSTLAGAQVFPYEEDPNKVSSSYCPQAQTALHVLPAGLSHPIFMIFV